MLYSNRTYPFNLFNKITDFDERIDMSKYQNHLVIYKNNKIWHIGRLMFNLTNDRCIIQTLWEIADTIEYIPVSSITHVSISSYLST